MGSERDQRFRVNSKKHFRVRAAAGTSVSVSIRALSVAARGGGRGSIRVSGMLSGRRRAEPRVGVWDPSGAAPSARNRLHRPRLRRALRVPSLEGIRLVTAPLLGVGGRAGPGGPRPAASKASSSVRPGAATVRRAGG